ncbi:MAG: hypothetical protein HIU82_12585 [Proteobacteria bacterium]|nr:hypothetical protein [Pseudomonadota bacterium]
MRIGVPKEIATEESRVGLTPAGARELVRCGHAVLVEHDAGGIGIPDAAAEAAGATIAPDAAAVFAAAGPIVTAPQPALRAGLNVRGGRSAQPAVARVPGLADTMLREQRTLMPDRRIATLPAARAWRIARAWTAA